MLSVCGPMTSGRVSPILSIPFYMTPAIQTIVLAFDKNVDQIGALMNFDQEVQDHAIRIVEELRKAMELRHSESTLLDNGLMLLRNVRSNESLRPRYTHVRNHCVVLLVSLLCGCNS